ncbi:26S proteasome non-ATPase regulatory subunit 7 [Cryptotermes secundus]|uniref:26S proteasome non-ATPase regulatory subunit 7 n=1 Tax=Cryptotermes secundus TaxID=105785 RepID=A0A2J7QY35_9NEOP|nr:26S proteasome non-ATPase regulatory subunit 7 [Cryptotermes secundus]
MPSQEVVTNKVVVHPLVLLSVVDHFNRMGKIGNQKRVVGVLLGCWRAKGVLDVSNSFAAREKIVGWYHTGPKLHQNDVAINELIRRYCPNSVLVIIDAKPKDLGLPTEAYRAVEEVHDDGSPTSKTFEHVPSEIGAEEAEEVGVEHLLRDIKDTTVGTLSQRITNQLLGLKGLHSQIRDIRNYLVQVVQGKLPINHQIVYQLQDIFNLLPDISHGNFVNSLYIKTNDQMLVVYLAALIRSIIALHNLINNKLTNRDAEKKEGKKDDIKDSKEKKEEKTKEEIKVEKK